MCEVNPHAATIPLGVLIHETSGVEGSIAPSEWISIR
ncbi:MAG: hypothetical protein RL057_667, partial [Actinomycetota bacterium]